jgi:hypothetical protein
LAFPEKLNREVVLNIIWVSGKINNDPLIFFVYPSPKGSEENQFTPLGVGVNKLIFE